MSKVDWSLAPKDAQIYSPADGKVNSCWYKKEGCKVYCWLDGCHSWSTRERMIGELIERPKQTQTWSGPEDWLPPTGTVCELRTKRGGWGEAEIKYQGRRGICVWLWVRHDGNSEQVEWAESPDKLEFRAIRTPAQIASEKRETAIRELMDIAQVDCRVTAARLVDAGFKR